MPKVFPTLDTYHKVIASAVDPLHLTTDCRSAVYLKFARAYTTLMCLERAKSRPSWVARDRWVHNPKAPNVVEPTNLPKAVFLETCVLRPDGIVQEYTVTRQKSGTSQKRTCGQRGRSQRQNITAGLPVIGPRPSAFARRLSKPRLRGGSKSRIS